MLALPCLPGGKSNLVRPAFRPTHHGWCHRAMQRPAALSAVSLVAVVLSLVAREVGNRGHQSATVLWWLWGLRPCYCPDTILQPFFRNLRSGPSTYINTTLPCTETSPSPSSTQLTRFSPPTQTSTHAPSPFPGARDITLVGKSGKRNRQPSENSELVSFVSVFASFPILFFLGLAPQERAVYGS